MPIPRTCKHCQAPYQGPRLKFCSDACMEAHRAAYLHEYHAAYHRKARGKHRAETVAKVHAPRPCQRKDCGISFTPTHGRQIYCCHRCTVKANVSSFQEKKAAAFAKKMRQA